MGLRERYANLKHAREVAALNRQAKKEGKEVATNARKVQIERIRAAERERASVQLHNLQKSRAKISEELEILATFGRQKKNKQKKQRIKNLAQKLEQAKRRKKKIGLTLHRIQVELDKM